MDLSKEALYDGWQASGLEEKEYWKQHLSDLIGYNKYHGKVYRRGLEVKNAALRAEVEQLRAQIKIDTISLYEPSARDDTDWQQWEQHLTRMEALPRMVKVCTMYDAHLPDDDGQAMELALRINALVQPDVTILGSDFFDFDVLSLKYARMYNRKRRDPFGEVRERYNNIVSRLIAGNPNGIYVAIGDNHAQIRLENFINTLIPMFGDMVTGAYNELVRSNNRVLWLGWSQEVFIGPALFEHGKKAGANPALANFKGRGGSMTGIAGHAHKWMQHVEIKHKILDRGRRVMYYPLISVVTGCLQHTPPHYVQDTKAINWAQGCAVVHINMHGLDTHVQNILFHPREDGSLVAVFGEQELVQQSSAQAVRVQAA